jgi:hypothetical protein
VRISKNGEANVFKPIYISLPIVSEGRDINHLGTLKNCWRSPLLKCIGKGQPWAGFGVADRTVSKLTAENVNAYWS